MSSIRENIVDDVVTGLGAMSVATGYNYDWNYVQRWVQAGDVRGYPTAMVEAARERLEQLVYPLYHRVLSVEVVAVHKVHRTASNDPDAAASALIEDIERKLMADISRGGNAVNTRLVSNERDLGLDPYVWVQVIAEVDYRTKLTDPASKIT